jgi:hypothetical protein
MTREGRQPVYENDREADEDPPIHLKLFAADEDSSSFRKHMWAAME